MATAVTGEPTFSATVTDLSAGGATPTGGTVTFNVIREITPPVTVTIIPTATPTPTPTSTPTSTGNPTPGQIAIRRIGPTPAPGVAPPPGGRPIPPGFLRTSPMILRIATKMVYRLPEIIIYLDQAIESKNALNTDWYSVQMFGPNTDLEMNGALGVAVSRVLYQRRTHTITLVMPRTPKLHGNVRLTVDGRAIVNLVGQELEGDSANVGDNLVREIDLP